MTNVFCLYFGTLVVPILNPKSVSSFSSLCYSDFVKDIQQYRKPEKSVRALWRSDSLHPSSGLTIISPSPVVLIFMSLDLFRELLQVMFSLSEFSDTHCACILLLLGRLPLNHCSGKRSRKLLEESDRKGNIMQEVFILYTATFEAVSDFSQLQL